MKYFSMFSGIGGFELGIQRAYSNKQFAEIEQDRKGRNWNFDEARGDVLPTSRSTPFCIGYSEVNKYATQVYEKHFKGHKNYGDARRIIPEEISEFEFLCGGFPCQAFSIAGKRGGFKDTRGTLFFEIARIISVKRPKLLLLENVKGLLSHDNGRTFGTIIATLSELGYICQWHVLNSKDFGVPQNRERVFIVGHLGIESFRKVFPIGSINEKSFDKLAKTVMARDYKGVGNQEMTLIEVTKDTHQGNRVYDPKGLSQTLNSGGGGLGAKSGLYAVPVLTPNREKKRQNGRRIKEDGDDSFTLTSQDIHGIYDGHNIRRLTPIECERLQGFPDGWTDILSDSQRYKCLGNAVTVNVIEAIIKEII